MQDPLGAKLFHGLYPDRVPSAAGWICTGRMPTLTGLFTPSGNGTRTPSSVTKPSSEGRSGKKIHGGCSQGKRCINAVRPGIDLSRSTVLKHAAVLHDQNTFSQGQCFGLIVSHIDKGGTQFRVDPL